MKNLASWLLALSLAVALPLAGLFAQSLPVPTGTTIPWNYTRTHVHATGSTPVLSACGTGPVLGLNSNDIAGRVTTGTGAGTACTITFMTAYGDTPWCIVSAQNVLASYTVSRTAITITSTAVSTIHNYFCVGPVT